MTILGYAYVFIGGLVCGSFLNVVILRLGVKSGIFTGRSECPSCQNQLAWYDLIPVLSYFVLRGKCRSCKASISLQYVCGEMLTAILFTLLWWQHGGEVSILFFVELIAIAALIVIGFFDARHFIIPDAVLFPLGFLMLSYDMLYRWQDINTLLLSAFSFALFFGIIYAVSRGAWMGFGDVKLVFVIGIILGYPLGFWAILGAVWIAAGWGIALLLFQKAKPDSPLPFGSFLAAGAIVGIIFDYAIKKNLDVFYRLF